MGARFFNLAYLLPLFVIFRVLALSGRQVWIGLWIFVAGNWVGQDYLAPQAFAYFIYLTIIAVILGAFRRKMSSLLSECSAECLRACCR